jgi:hypothetical protein
VAGVEVELLILGHLSAVADNYTREKKLAFCARYVKITGVMLCGLDLPLSSAAPSADLLR